MSKAFGHLMERNLREVFGQRDSERRKVAINELDTEDCTFFEAEEQIVGPDALNAKVGAFFRRIQDSSFDWYLPAGESRSRPLAVAIRPEWSHSCCHRDGCRGLRARKNPRPYTFPENVASH